MTRLDVYTAVHKMQRARLFGLVIETGKTDAADAIAAAEIAGAVHVLSDELIAHARHEDRFIHPLLRAEAPRIAQRLEAAHEDLDTQLFELRELAATFSRAASDPNALYRRLAGFTAIYLDHLACEEQEALPPLWSGCSDAQLMGILVSFRDARSPAGNLTSVLSQLPTLSPPEIAGMAAVTFDGTPAAELIEVLATVLEPRQLGSLRRLLGSGPEGT